MHVTKRTLVGTLAATALTATMFGCSSAPTTPQAAAPAEQAPEVQADRQVMATGDEMNFAQVWSALPKTISEADAATMLVTIDPSKIAPEGDFSVQQGYGRYGGGRHGGRSFSGIRGSFFGHRGIGSFGRRHSNFRYFNFRGNYFPYYRYGSIFRPYYYNNYYPYYTYSANTYYPYCNRW